MDFILDAAVLRHLAWALVALALLLGLNRVSRTVIYIRNDSVGVVEKLWSFRGSVRDGFLALAGEAGFRPDVLRGGLHVFVPFQYRIHVQPLVTVPQGTIGYVFARGGRTLPAGQTLGSWPAGTAIEEARAFLANGGERGPQRRVLREGVYAVNTAQFVVFTAERTYAVPLRDDAAAIRQMRELVDERVGFEPVVIPGADDLLGIVTTHDGPALDHDEIIAATVGVDPADPAHFHNSSRTRRNSWPRAGGAGGRSRCWSKAPITSTACSRPSSSCPRR